MISDEGTSTPFGRFGSGERDSAERGIALGLLTVRSLHLAQGIITLASGWKAYRRPKTALALLLASIIESGWLAHRALSARSYADPDLAWIDTGFGVAGLVVMAVTTAEDDKTAWINWMCPYTFGTTAGGAAAIRGRASSAVPVILAGTYVLTVRRNIRSGGSQMATALANTTSYIGFYLAARSFGGRLRSNAEKLAEARQETIRERERLATLRERNREHRLLHDSALQTLELIARGDGLGHDAVRDQARREAAAIRRAISLDPVPVTSLVFALETLVEEAAQNGMRVDLALVDTSLEPAPDIREALLGAVREAVTNAAKHSGAERVVVSLNQDQDGIRFVIRDHGRGFDPDCETNGFGIRQSIAARLREVGGRSRVTSTPGRGTKVELWAPA